jgi:hypothetical protein
VERTSSLSKTTFDLILHKHEMRMGIDFRANQMNVGSEAFADGFWLIGNSATLPRTVAPNQWCCCLPAIPRPISCSAYRAAAFTTRPTMARHRPPLEDLPALRRGRLEGQPSLTLNLSLAWDLTTPITEEHNAWPTTFLRTGQLLVANQNGVSSRRASIWIGRRSNPASAPPGRFFGSEKTVLRAGYALYHDSAWSQGAQGLWQNPPFLGESDNSRRRLRLCNLVLRLHGGSRRPLELQSLQRISTSSHAAHRVYLSGFVHYEPTNFKLGRVQQYNVNVERQLPATLC